VGAAKALLYKGKGSLRHAPSDSAIGPPASEKNPAQRVLKDGSRPEA